MSVRAQITEMVTKSLFLGDETRKFILTTLERDVPEEKLMKIYEALKQIHEKENAILTKTIQKNPNFVANVNGTLAAARRQSILAKEAQDREEEESAVLDEMESNMGSKNEKNGFFSRLFGSKK